MKSVTFHKLYFNLERAKKKKKTILDGVLGGFFAATVSDNGPQDTLRNNSALTTDNNVKMSHVNSRELNYFHHPLSVYFIL